MLEMVKFPVRPARQLGESLAGFIARHYAANGHTTPAAVHAALAIVYQSGDNPMRATAWQTVCTITGDAREEDRRRWIERPFDGANARFYRKAWLRSSYSTLKICPECVGAHGLHLALWEFPLIEVCILHKSVLVEYCVCGSRLTWRKLLAGWKCRCKLPLADLVAAKASIAQIAMASDVLRSEGIPLPESHRNLHFANGTTRPKDLATHYEDVAMVLGLRALIVQTNAPRAMPVRPPARAMGSLMASWPGRFEPVLARLLRFKLRRKAGLLVALQLDDSVIKLLMHLRAASYNNLLSDAARSCLTQLVASIDTRMYADARVVFNPSLEIATREQQLARLASWWCGSIAPMVEPSHSALTTAAVQTQVALRPEDQTVYPTIAKILNLLVEAAHAGLPAERLRRFAMAWPPMDDVRHLEPSELLVHLAAQLQAATPAHVGFLAELVEQSLQRVPK